MNKVLKDIVNRYKLLRGHVIKYAHDCLSFFFEREGVPR